MSVTSRTDPQRLSDAKRRFGGAIATRFSDIKGVVNTSIIERDSLSLQSSRASQLQQPQPMRQASGSDGDKLAAFLAWLKRVINSHVLETSRQGTVMSGDHYTSTYVKQAYLSGLRHANQSARSADFDVEETDVDRLVQRGVHRNSLETHYVRTYQDLEGVTDATRKHASRELSDVLESGSGSRYRISSEINDRIDKVGITRGRTLSRTALSRTHTAATLQRFQELGVEEVSGLAEFQTAGDRHVCPICLALEGNTYTIEEARGVIPVHPNCRCVFIAVSK